MSLQPSAVPDHFYVVHLDLAREPAHPEGSADDRYTLMLPLTADGRIIASEARAFADDCRVSHAVGQDEIRRGLIRRDGEGSWIFDFGEAGAEPEIGFRFAQDRFSPGEYVSILRDGQAHPYRVVSLQPV